jgi:hypothetical protein
MGSTLNVSDRYGKTENKRREAEISYKVEKGSKQDFLLYSELVPSHKTIN